MKQEIRESNAAPHALSHSNYPQDSVWSHDQLPYQAVSQQVQTIHQTNFVAQSYVFCGNDISQTTGDTVISGSWLASGNAFESSVTPVLGRHDQGGT